MSAVLALLLFVGALVGFLLLLPRARCLGWIVGLVCLLGFLVLIGFLR